jgi:DNA-binding NarL/FixJ family response regulator
MYVHHAAIALGGCAVWEIGDAEFAPAYRRMVLTLMQAEFGDNTLPHEQTIARMATLLGDTIEAQNYFALARAKSEAAGQKPIRAIADYDEALALIRAGSADRAHILTLIDAALAAFESLGMGGWAKRALALKEKLPAPAPAAGSAGRVHMNGLTQREIEVLRLLAAGGTNKEIAEALVLSPRTVEQHIAHIYGKIGARGRADATSYAFRHGLAQLDARYP